MLLAITLFVMASLTQEVFSERKVGCLFRPSKPSELVRTKDSKECERKCASSTLCTHFNWSAGGQCEMFQTDVATKDRFPMRPSEPLGACGVNFPVWKERKGGFYADHCKFPEDMEPFHSSSIPWDECIEDCHKEKLCTHFSYDARSGTCHLMGWLASQGGDKTVVLSKNTNSPSSCGYFIRYSPSAVQVFVHNNWHYLLVGLAVLTLTAVAIRWRNAIKNKLRCHKRSEEPTFISSGQLYEIREMEELTPGFRV